MTDAEKISTTIEMLKRRLYWLDIQYDKVTAKVNIPGKYEGVDLGMLAEERYMLGREKQRIEMILDVLERGYFSEDDMPLFDGRRD